MKSEMILKFKTMFENQKKNLVYTHGVINEDFCIQKDDLIDDVDQTSTELETAMRMRLRNREALFLKKIDEALRRIEAGSFGLCEACGEDIELKRLEARPTANHCVGCKEEQERREQVHIDGTKSKSLGAKLRVLA